MDISYDPLLQFLLYNTYLTMNGSDGRKRYCKSKDYGAYTNILVKNNDFDFELIINPYHVVLSMFSERETTYEYIVDENFDEPNKLHSIKSILGFLRELPPRQNGIVPLITPVLFIQSIPRSLRSIANDFFMCLNFITSMYSYIDWESIGVDSVIQYTNTLVLNDILAVHFNLCNIDPSNDVQEYDEPSGCSYICVREQGVSRDERVCPSIHVELVLNYSYDNQRVIRFPNMVTLQNDRFALTTREEHLVFLFEIINEQCEVFESS